MAVQPNNRKPEQQPTAGKINRTPAPDEISQIRNPKGVGTGYGMDGPQPSSIASGQAMESPLASNLRQSQADSEDVLSQVIAHGVAGRNDRIPADGVDWQRRVVRDDSYPLAHGMAKRGPSTGSPGGLVPDKTGWNPAVQVRQPKR
jgi:hypothetical protein